MGNTPDSNDAINSQKTFRSPLLMNATDSAMVVIDVQEKLLPLIQHHESIVANIVKLIKGAQTLSVPTVVTEQYPKGLGATVETLTEQLGNDQAYPDKTMFSCREYASSFSTLADAGVRNVLLTGIETHVCVAQTGLDLIAAGFNVFVCVDAVGSRNAIDHDTAIRRLENSGATPTTTEAVLFEWCERAGSPEFNVISKIVQGKH